MLTLLERGQVFKAYSVQTLTEAVSFVQDLKLGHYVKIPPRATFLGACECECRASWWCGAFRH